ncbi:hypothetical protein [Pseudooctadecabacter jejudonensis]|uniref:Uncharacterized protein n=1 Tax=Pseudooctadecabacter jejudonensis TaxID=1391910 RepID=A0A1Y5RVG5_9RHOB|nr:hypothetical protein [Pseudooctadecabacter jejudonensis]SLN23728.1 hypothetical protein PSJ8397_01014 [Pseudooctadecabacter jejudonensis]
MKRYPGRVEDYTNAFLVTAFGILFMAFFTIAATFGIVWVMLSAALIDGLIRLRAARISDG